MINFYIECQEDIPDEFKEEFDEIFGDYFEFIEDHPELDISFN